MFSDPVMMFGYVSRFSKPGSLYTGKTGTCDCTRLKCDQVESEQNENPSISGPDARPKKTGGNVLLLLRLVFLSLIHFTHVWGIVLAYLLPLDFKSCRRR